MFLIFGALCRKFVTATLSGQSRTTGGAERPARFIELNPDRGVDAI